MYLHQELRKAREEAGLTQMQLAQLAGMPRNQIVRAERGDNITIETLRTIVAHLPVKSLTLLANVQLTADLVHQPQKLYLAAMETLNHMTLAMGSALNLAMEARVAMENARKNDPLAMAADPDEISADGEVLLTSIAEWYRELVKTVRDAATFDK